MLLSQALFFAGLLFTLLLVKIFKPSAMWLALSLVWGVGLGLGLSALYYYNLKKKTEACEVVSAALPLVAIIVACGNTGSGCYSALASLALCGPVGTVLLQPENKDGGM